MSLTASWYVIGVHVEDLADAALEAARDLGAQGSQRRTLVANSRHIEERLDDGTGVRHAQVKDKVKGRATKVVELRLSHGWHHGQHKVHLYKVLLHKLRSSILEGDIHVDVDGGAALGEHGVEAGVVLTHQVGVLRQTQRGNGTVGTVRHRRDHVVVGLLRVCTRESGSGYCQVGLVSQVTYLLTHSQAPLRWGSTCSSPHS